MRRPKASPFTFSKELKGHLQGAFRGVFLATLIFQLCVFSSPMAFAQSQEAMTGNPTAPMTVEEQLEACNADPARRWDPELNSCVVKQEVMDTKGDTLTCQNSENPEQCFKDNASDKSGVASGDRFQSSKMDAIGSRVAAAYSLFALATGISNFDKAFGVTENDLKKHSKESKGKCTSKTIFAVTSVAWTVGDFFLKKRAKKNFEELAKNYEEEVNNDNLKGSEAGSYQAQVRAFHYLRQEQEQIEDQAKKRKLLQLSVVAGYAAALGFSIYEMTPAGWPGACKKYSQGNIEKMNTSEDQLFNAAENSSSDLTAEFASYDEVSAKMDSWVNQVLNLGTSAQISVGAGIMLALNAYLIMHANNEQERANNNISAIDYMLKTFSEYTAGFCPDGRDDLKNERCYCYTEDGEQNPNRSNSVICQNLFKADNINYALKKPALKPLDEGPRRGCITVTGQFDYECKCRQMINNVTKQNACSKAPNSLAFNSGVGAQLGAGRAVSTLGNFGQGANKALASLNSGSLANSAAKKKKLVDSMLNQARAKGIKVPSSAEFEKIAEKLVEHQGRKLANNPNANVSGPLTMASNLRPAGMDQALAMAEKKAGLDKASPDIGVTKATSSVGPGRKKGDFKLNWNDSAGGEGNKVQTFMDKNYKYKDSDIVKRDDVSLWNVISHRYQTSGLKRLFGDDED
jgi:hypothetical protein